MTSWKCQNCGHEHPATDLLTELSFKWIDDHTCTTSCSNCKSYTIQRATSYDDKGYPLGGYFLMVRAKLRR